MEERRGKGQRRLQRAGRERDRWEMERTRRTGKGRERRMGDYMEARTDGRKDGRKGEKKEERMEGKMEGIIDGRMDGWKDGRKK